MPKIRSLVIRVEFDRAKRSHGCQANGRHRIERGDIRLKVRKGRSWDHYCSACAENIIAHDIEKLTALRKMQPAVVNE
jgi:hypothetical protein